MNKEKQIDNIMKSLQGMHRAEPSPFFNEKINARIQHGNFESRFVAESGGFWRWGLAVVMSALIMMNILFLIQAKQSEKKSMNQMAEVSEEVVYNLNQQLIYQY